MKSILLTLIFFLMAHPVFAERIVLDNGRVIEGRVIEVTDDYIRVITEGKVMRLPFRSMDFDSAHYYRTYQVQPYQLTSEEAGFFEETAAQPKTYRDFANEGMAFAQQGELEKAVEYFSRAIEARDDIGQLYLFRAGVYQDLGKIKKAVSDYTQAIRLNPGNAELYARRAWVYQGSGQADLAIKDYSKSLEIDPYNMEILMERYALHAASGKHYFALQDLDMILQLDPEAVEVYRDYAFLNYRMGNYYTAWQNVDKALRAGVEVPKDFIKALDEKFPNPFIKAKGSSADLINRARDVLVENAGFFIAAVVSILLAVFVLWGPSFRKQSGPEINTEEADPEKFLRPVLFVKASVIRRMCAAVIDLIVLSTLSWAVVILLRKDIFAALLGILYLLRDVFGGVSVGKGLIGLRVVDEHGYRSVFFQGFLRNFTFGLPLVLFYVIFWTAGFRVDMNVKIALLALCGCFLIEGMVMILSRKSGQRLGDRMGGVFVHDLHPGRRQWLFAILSLLLFAGFLFGTVIANMAFNKAFIYRLNPLRYYYIDHDLSFVMAEGWNMVTEGEGGFVLEHPETQGSFVFVINEDTKDYTLEVCVRAFTRSIQDAGLEKMTEEALQVSGVPAVKVGFIERGAGTGILFVYFKKDRWGPLYILQASSPLQAMPKVMSGVMNMVNSLRFE